MQSSMRSTNICGRFRCSRKAEKRWCTHFKALFPTELSFLLFLIIFEPHRTSWMRPDALPCVHRHALLICNYSSLCSAFVCFSKCAYFIFDYYFLTLAKNFKRGWFNRWPPWSFNNPIWNSDNLCLHWSVLLLLCFGLFYVPSTVFWFILRTFHWQLVTSVHDAFLYCFCLLPGLQSRR